MKGLLAALIKDDHLLISATTMVELILLSILCSSHTFLNCVFPRITINMWLSVHQKQELPVDDFETKPKTMTRLTALHHNFPTFALNPIVFPR